MIPWYAIKPGPERQTAKEAATPQPLKTKGGLIAGNGITHPIRCAAERKLIHLLASVEHDPIPRHLLRLERIAGHLMYIGTSGRVYDTFDVTPRTASIALDHAIIAEERARLYAKPGEDQCPLTIN